MVLALRVREACVPNLNWAEHVLPSGPGPQWLTELPDPVRRLMSEEGYLQGAPTPVEETQAPQAVQQDTPGMEAVPLRAARRYKKIPRRPMPSLVKKVPVEPSPSAGEASTAT